MDSAYQTLLNEWVTLDVKSSAVYLGRLVAADEAFVTLEDADVHDMNDSSVSKEVYIMEAARNGVHPSRHRVAIRQSQVVSISALADIIRF